MLAGFDQAVFRTTPPPHELVLKGSPVRGLSGEDGDARGELIITLPGDEAPPVEAAPVEDEAPAVEGEAAHAGEAADPAPESSPET